MAVMILKFALVGLATGTVLALAASSAILSQLLDLEGLRYGHAQDVAPRLTASAP
jgi:hypothetical protein